MLVEASGLAHSINIVDISISPNGILSILNNVAVLREKSAQVTRVRAGVAFHLHWHDCVSCAIFAHMLSKAEHITRDFKDKPDWFSGPSMCCPFNQATPF